MGQLVLGVKAGEMDWSVGAEIFNQPGGHALDFFEIIGVGGDDEVNDLEPDPETFVELQRVEDGLQLARIELAIDLVTKTFEIHMSSIDVLGEFAQGTLFDGAAGDEDVF